VRHEHQTPSYTIDLSIGLSSYPLSDKSICTRSTVSASCNNKIRAMKVGIIGSGTVGKTLAKGFFKHGYSVMIGARDKNTLLEWSKSKGMGIAAGSFAQVATHGDFLVLAVKGECAKDALALCKESDLRHKLIIDTTNPIDSKRKPVNGVLPFFTDLNLSLMEILQTAYPNTYFVKAFNSVGSDLMVNPVLEHKPSMFICGNHSESKARTAAILDLFGWEVEDMGMMEAARAIEPLCMLWCISGFRNETWKHALKLVR